MWGVTADVLLPCLGSNILTSADILAANYAGASLIGGSIGNVMGAFAVSLFGSIYEQKFHGYAFVLMVPGVLLLVPVRASPQAFRSLA